MQETTKNMKVTRRFPIGILLTIAVAVSYTHLDVYKRQCRDFTKAERIMAINSPMMQFCVYAGMAFVLSFGSYMVITSQGAEVAVGQMSAILTYSFQILMSLMMLSMVFVMITMSLESAERIVEVLSEKSLSLIHISKRQVFL